MKPMRFLCVPLLVGVLAAAVAAQTFPITNFEAFTAPSANGTVMFRQPSFSGSTGLFIDGAVNTTQVVAVGIAYSGTRSLRVNWQFVSTAPPANRSRWLRLTTFNTTNLPNPALDFAHALRFRMYVASGTPDFYLTLGVRETGTTVPIGGNGGTGGGIEWLGATSNRVASDAPIGKLITAKDQWIEVVFNIPVEPVLAFAGATANGTLDTARGTLEQLAFTPVDPNAIGPYLIYLDDFEQVAVHPISGNVELRDYEGDITQVPVAVELRQGGNVVRTATVSLDANGNYTIPAVLPGTYDLAFKASHWLRTVVQGVTVGESAVTGVDVSLTNGDIDGDNEVTLFDFGALVAAFGAVPGH
ncbi:MAG: carboxypeptidase-like regulatory domain-containing protein, partial [Armatimonadota bacterium]|nr:carboxypeptidase-like regulatory domain-containing protein [Armatimonadota bacterium]